MKVHVTGLCKKTSKEITKPFDVTKEGEARKLAKKNHEDYSVYSQ